MGNETQVDVKLYTVDLVRSSPELSVSIHGIEASNAEQAERRALAIVQGGEDFWRVVGVDHARVGGAK